MRWKSVALAGAAWPAVAGCSIVHNAARNLVNEPEVVCTQKCIEHDLRKQARAAWQEVRCEYPRRAFTCEFRDGFLDGYVDYLDRGGNGSLPAAPPSKYTRHKKYYTENGQCLVKDYFLGFKYGQDIAIATGKRQFLTVPVLLPQQPVGPPAFVIQPPPAVVTPVVPDPVRPPVPIPPKPGSDSPPKTPSSVLPAPKPLPSKFDTEPPRVNPDSLPVPTPPLPVPVKPAGGFDVNPPPVIEVPAEPAAAPGRLRLPPPPADVPELPAHVPTPSVLDELPVIPPVHDELPVIPPNHPEAGK